MTTAEVKDIFGPNPIGFLTYTAEGRMSVVYRIIEKLGGGGMGVVYKAERTRLHRTVARCSVIALLLLAIAGCTGTH